MEPAPEIDRVEWLSASPEAVLVRVHAHRSEPRSEDEVKLIIDDGGRRLVFPPDVGLHVDYHTGVWSAAFTIPIELRPRLEAGLALEVAGVTLALPGALAGPGEGSAASVDAQVIDRGVLAERRARRAELAEQSLLRRASDAEATVNTLQRQLSHLEQRFARTNDELERLRRHVAEGDAERRRLRQREYAEQQQRLEAEERVRDRDAQLSGESEGLRASLREAERQTENLAAELELAQRALAEAQHAAAGEQAELRREREQLALREAELAERERGEPSAEDGDPRQRVFVRVDSTEERVNALAEQLRSISDHLERREVALEEAVAAERATRDALAAERRRHNDELAALQRRVEQLRSDLATAIGLVRDGLQAEHSARVRAETELREQIDAYARLSEELERARTDAASTALALGELPLAQPPADSSEAELRRQREEMAEALAAAVARLRDRVAEFEQVPTEPQAAADAAPGAPAVEAASVAAAAVEAASVAEPAAAPPDPATLADEVVTPAADEASAAPGSDLISDAAPADAVELPARLQGVRPRPSDWLSTAMRRAAIHRDAQLVGELVAELLPAQGLVVKRATTYGVTIDDVGCYRVATTGLGPASVTRVEPPTLRELDFEVRGSVASVGAFVAGRGRWRLRGLRVTPGRRHRVRRVARARREPLTLAELAGANIRVWPGLLLPALAEAVDAKWTSGERFLIAFVITGTTPTTLFVGVDDGAPITVSPRRQDLLPAATLYLSERACLNLLARTPLPAGERVLCSGDVSAAGRLLDWLDRAQGYAGTAS